MGEAATEALLEDLGLYLCSAPRSSYRSSRGTATDSREEEGRGSMNGVCLYQRAGLIHYTTEKILHEQLRCDLI